MMENTRLQQVNKFSEVPNTSENEDKQQPLDDSLPSTSNSTSIGAMVPTISSTEFNKISKSTPEEILESTDNSRKTYDEKAQNENDRNQFNVYNKRPGTDDQGKEYEYLMCAYYALKLCFDENVVDFEITTNNKDYGDFDDVAFKVTFADNSSHHFLMQMKHTKEPKGVTDNMLSAQKGDFSLLKYFQSFQKLQDRDNVICIVFTNRKAQLNDKSEFKLEDECITVNECQPHKFNYLLIDTASGDDTAHIFSFKQKEQQSQNFEHFFKSFYLLTNQKNSSNMQLHIDNLLYERFGCKVDFIGFMRQWWKGKFVLHKHDVIVKLAELVLSPFVQEIPEVTESLSNKAELLKNAIMQFETTLVKDCDASCVAKIWMEESVDLEMMNKASLKFGFATTGFGDTINLTPKEFTKVLWFLNKVPLIVKYDEKEEKGIRAAIDLLAMETDKKKLVLVAKKLEEIISKRIVLKSLYDLRDTPFYKKIIAKFQVSLQGRQSINLEKLINSDKEIAKVIETKELFLMLEKDLSIGEKLPSLPVEYIPRILSHNNIFINKSRRNPLMCNPKSFSGYHTFKDEIESFDPFDRSFVNITNTIVNISVDEDKAFSTFNNPVNIVTGKPGIGKSTLMTYLSHHCPPDYWCVRVNLIEFENFFREEHSTEAIMDKFLKDEDPYFDKVKATFQQNKRSCFLFDGLDEIDTICIENVLTFIKEISSNGIRVWISTREHLKDKVSNYFKISPITIKELEKENQEEYIKKRLSNVSEDVNYTEDEANEIIARLFASVNLAYNTKNILGVPLLLFIITEIFRNDKSNFEKIKTDDIFVLTKMYKIFFEEKEQHLYKKAGVQNKGILDNDLDDKLERYELPALEASASKLLPKLGLDSKMMSKSQKFLEKIRHKGDPLGIISQVVGDKNNFRAIFSHQSFAEYFACVWLNENQDKLELIKDSFFEDSNDNLRLIFDIMLAEDKPLHVAVLYKNQDQVEKYINHYEEKDKGGRTALHLISSYSRNDSIIRMDSNFERIPKDIKIYQHLVMKCNPFEKDELFKWDCFDYTLCRYSLLLFEVLLETNKEIIDVNTIIERFHGFNKVTGSCCLYGYFHLLELTFRDRNRNSDEQMMKIEVDIFNIKLNKKANPLHLAASNGNVGIVELLLNKGYDINEGNEEKYTPLHFACLFGTYDVVIKILECGGDLNAVNNYKDTSLHLASINGNIEIIELLMKKGRQINEINEFKWNSLHYACLFGTHDAVIKILELGGDLNAVTAKKQTCLHLASANGKTEMIELLLSKGCKINLADEDNATPLHYACRSGTYDTVIKILQLGGDLSAVTKIQETPLHLASANGKTEIIELLFKKGYKINVTNEGDWVPLHYACLFGTYDSVIKILELGGDLNAVTNKQETPLHLASANGKTEIIELLLSKGCKINVTDKNSWIPLHYACRFGTYDAVIKILELGGDLNAVTNKQETPLHLASASGKTEIIELLLSKGCKINVTDEDNFTPLHRACQFGTDDAVMKILELGGDLNAVTNKQETPLHLASANGKTEIIELLLSKGCKINVADEDNFIPLHHACRFGTYDAVMKILEFGGELNAVTNKKQTPLHLASANGKTEIIELLLSKGCKINVDDEDNWTPLHFACRFGTYDAAMRILELGGDLNAVTNKQITPLHLASANGKTEIIELLVRKGCEVNIADEDNWTPLHFACNSEMYDAAIKILELGGNLNATTKKQQTPLHLASANSKIEMIELLILMKNGCKINVTNEDHHTPYLFYACGNGIQDAVMKILAFGGDGNAIYGKQAPLLIASANGKTEIIELLLRRGCDVTVADEDSWTALHYACRLGTYDAVIKILALGGDLNAVTNKQQTPLHLASANGKPEIIELLFRKGCKVNVPDKENFTALHYACDNGRYDAVLKILELGGDLKAVTNKQETPLHLASANGKTEIIELLSRKGCKINVANEDNWTPLHLACRFGNYDAAMTILELGGDLNAVTNKQETPLHLASANGKTEIIELLSRKGCKINVDDENNLNPLHYACIFGRHDAIIKLLELGGDLNAVTNIKRTPLHLALINGKPEIIQLLLKKGCKVNVADEDNSTPLHYSCRWGSYDVVMKILEFGGDINAVTNKKETPLHLASANGKTEIIELLLSKGCKINVVDEDNFTPLHSACRFGTYDAVIKILELGGDLNAVSNKKQTPLHLASANGKPEIIELLLSKECTINVADEDNCTPLHYACGWGAYDAVIKILELGGDINATDKNGWTPLRYACEKNHFDVIEALLETGAHFNAECRNILSQNIHNIVHTGKVRLTEILLQQLTSTEINGALSHFPSQFPTHLVIRNGHLQPDLLLKMAKFRKEYLREENKIDTNLSKN